MLANYLKRLIGQPKIDIKLDKPEYTAGGVINGSIEFEGGLIKNKISRIDIDLLGEKKSVHDALNSMSVLCSQPCHPHKKESISFILTLPEELEREKDYSLEFSVKLDNSSLITKRKTLKVS